MGLTSSLTFRNRFPGIIILVILLNLFFISYLALTSKTIIFHDSIGYENTARILAQGDWKNYFIGGPNREPLYSLLISLSMNIAAWLRTDYLAIQIMVQILILLISQLLTYHLLKRLNISDGICALVLAYMGLSPGIVSSGLILFSEVITYPIIVWFVLALSRAWIKLPIAPLKSSVVLGLQVAAPALVMIFTKAAFQIILPILLLPFIWQAYRAFVTKHSKQFLHIAIFLTVAASAVQLPVIAWKSANKHYNGIYTFTDRAPEALYGNTARRMKPLTIKRMQTSLAYMTGLDVCAHFYGPSCLEWGFLESDILGANKVHELRDQGIDRQRINAICVRDSVPIALSNPFQYLLLCLIEGLKMFFWEAPSVAYIAYPDFIHATYNSPWFVYTSRFLMAIVCLITFLWGIFHLYSQRKKFLSINQDTDQQTTHLFFLILMITAFTAVYSIFFVLPRYALPLAPLFLALIAQFIQTVFYKQKKTMTH